MSGVRRSDNSDEAAAFFSRQSSRRALADGSLDGTQKPRPDRRVQALAALARVDSILRSVSGTHEYAARRSRITTLRTDLRRTATMTRAPLLDLRRLLTTSDKLLRELSGTGLGIEHGNSFRGARDAANAALDRLPSSSAHLSKLG